MCNILERIKILTEQKRISIAELERRSNLGNGTIRRWDTSLPSAEKLQRVAKILGVTMDYLVNGEDEIDSKATILARNVNELSDEQRELIEKMIEQMKNDKK